MRRIGAGVLDVLFVIILSVLVSMALPGTAGVMVLFPPLWFFYHFLFDFLSGGMTYGKMIMKLKVEISSSRLGFAFFHALGKTVLWFLSGFLPLLLLCGNGRMPYDRWLRLKQTDSQGRELRIAKNGAALRRVGAAWVDVFVMTFLNTPAMVLIIIVSPLINLRFFTRYMIMITICILYMFICDYLFAGVTLGKLAAGLKVEFTGPISRLRFALLHTLCKCVVMPMYVIGFIIFLCCGGRMPYDRWLKFRIIEKN